MPIGSVGKVAAFDNSSKLSRSTRFMNNNNCESSWSYSTLGGYDVVRNNPVRQSVIDYVVKFVHFLDGYVLSLA